jgi:hypothetical protein
MAYLQVSIVDKMPLRLTDLSVIPGLAKLESLYLVGVLSLAFFTLPTLNRVELGPSRKVPNFSVGHSAPDITSLLLSLKETTFWGSKHIFGCLPSLEVLQLTLYPTPARDGYGSKLFNAVGHCAVGDLYDILEAAPSIQNVTITYGPGSAFLYHERHCPDLSQYAQLRSVEMAEDAFVGGAGTVRPPHSATANLLPCQIQSVVVTQAILHIPSAELQILSWFEELHKPDFPELQRIEIAYSKRIYFYDGDYLKGTLTAEDWTVITAVYMESVSMQTLRAEGVEVVVRLE